MAGVRVTVYPNAVQDAYRASTPRRVQIAHEIAADAITAAPVDSGEYRDGIHVESNGDDVRVVDDDPESFYKEYGTADTPAHAVLTDAARARGRYTGFQPKNSR